MMRSPKAANWPTEKLVERVTKPLVRQMAEIDIDVVDGEFFWRCCCPGLGDALDNLKQEVQDWRDNGTLNDVWRVSQILTLAIESFYQEFGLPPSVAIEYVANNGWLSMRAAVVYRPSPDELAGTRIDALAERHGVDQDNATSAVKFADAVIVRVHSAAWTGRDVEHLVISALHGRSSDAVQPASSWVPPLLAKTRTTIAPSEPGWMIQNHLQRPLDVQLTFTLHETDAQTNMGSGPVHVVYDELNERFHAISALLGPPFVEVTIGLPLPPEGAIAREYDAIVGANQQWTSLLTPAPGGEEIRTAIRTWATALLAKSGLTTNTALHRSGKLTEPHLPEGSQSDLSPAAYYMNRRALFARAPMAEECVALRPGK